MTICTGKHPTQRELDTFPLYVKFDRLDDGTLLLPADANAMLSDELVYAAMKETTMSQRARFKGVWDGNGHVRANCVPQDPAPRLDDHYRPGLEALLRLSAAQHGFKIAPKADEKMKAERSLFWASLVVLGDQVGTDANPDPEAAYAGGQR
ncbi:uncharacterized protein N7496_007068 [Penicillium cataractarum]|uniref:Uncharacterized protein n=1 Tax=Penicillium cataractarum TaxID=2100454 RepID=A0A9W9V982_9EURO|nr:uncharacterized protein N7496_007068 [Penicillium cataractarum]KAJ5370976.1 hypothetical protein N7496_007068 [Penicillium cataractarum]